MNNNNKQQNKENKLRVKSNILLATYTVILAYILLNLSTVTSMIGYIIGIVSPFILAIAIAFVLNMPVKFFENKVFYTLDKSKNKHVRNIKRPLSIISAILTIVGLVIALVFFVIPQLSASINTLVDGIPEYLKILEGKMTETMGSIDILNEAWNEVLLAWKEIIQVAGKVTGALLSQLLDITIGVTSSIINFFIAVILAIYMLANKEILVIQIKKILYAYSKKNKADYIVEIGTIANAKFSSFIIGQCTEAVIIGALCFVGMLILRMPYALLISVIIGVTALIPIFGAFIGTIPSAFIILMVDPRKAFWFIIFIIVIQQIEGNLIYPKVVGSSLGLSALWVMFAMMVGASMFGLLGMLVGIPLFAVIYSVFGTITNKKLIDKNIKVN